MHTFESVYREMLIQIVHEFAGIGDWRQLSDHEIRFFYNGIRRVLKERTKK